MKNPSAAPYKVLIADVSATVRQALRWALEGLPDFTIVGEASRGDEALALADTLQPDIVLLETDLAGLDGYAAARAMKSLLLPPYILFLTIHSDTASRQRCFEAGADAFLPKSAGWTALVALMRRLLEEYEDESPSPPVEEAAVKPDGD